MENKELTFSEKYQILNNVYHYLLDKNIDYILNITGNPLNLTKRDVQEFTKDGFSYFIRKTSDNYLDYFISLEKFFETQNNLYIYENWKNLVKVIYSFEEPSMADDLNVIEEKVVDLNSYDGINWMKNLYESVNPIKIHKICKWCDSVSIRVNGLNQGRAEQDVDVFDGDCYHVGDSFNAFKKKMVIATIGEYYKVPTYRELLWAEKYGYFTPQGKLNFDEEIEPIRLPELNHEGNYNSHKISLGAYCKYMGNISVSHAFLNPIKNKEGKK